VEVLVFAIGAMIGSFLNVCILRMPKDESIAFPASHCPKCQRPIAWYDNIPIVSFLFLRARCRNCHAKISWQYPLIEALTGALFVLFFTVWGFTPKGFLYLYLALALLVQTVIDFRYRIIPDAITLPAIVVGIAASTAFPEIHGQLSALAGFRESLVGMLAGGGFLYAVGTVAEKILKKEAMGGGDVKLLAAIGAALGWRGVLLTIFLSSITGSIAGIYAKLKRGDELIPYGPFLALGAFLHMFFGPQLVATYFNYLRTV
jgi:leader peptidase (prepilin peptidase) / N-methyltransferase